MQWAESCRAAELPGGSTRYHKGAARQGSPLWGEGAQGEDGEGERATPQPLLAVPTPPTHTHAHTMTGEGEVMCTESILDCCQGEGGVGQEVESRTSGGRRGPQWSVVWGRRGLQGYHRQLAGLLFPDLLLGTQTCT